MNNKHFGELDDKTEILEALRYLRTRDIEVNWVTCEDNIGFGGSMALMGNIVVAPPTMPTSVTIYINRDMTSMSIQIKNVLDGITFYDNYIDSMKSNKEILEIKKIFEDT